MPDITRKFVKDLEARLGEKGPMLLQIVIGPRQVGKTTGVQQLVERIANPSHVVSADSPIPKGYEWLRQQWETALQLGKNSLFIVDEIQKVQGWSEVVKELFDRDRRKQSLKIVFLGSASLTLRRGAEESLAGRFEILNVPHWSLEECERGFGWSAEEYLKFGGYPAPAHLISDSARWQDYLKFSILEPVISRDITPFVDIRKPALFRQLCELILRYPAQEISYQKLLGQLQDHGNVTTIKHYLTILEAAFLIKQIYRYSTRPLSSVTSSPKVIPLCPALIHVSVVPEQLEIDPEWRGRVFEAAVGAKLTRTRGELYYWRENKFEVDYVLKLNGKIYAIEVKSGRTRNISGLDQFAKQFPKSIRRVIDLAKGIELLRSEDVDAFIQNS